MPEKNKIPPGLFMQLLIILPVFACFVSSCGLPVISGKKGLLEISLPGSKSGDARSFKIPDAVIDNMAYVLEFTGPGVKKTVNADAGETIILELEPGRWNINVDAHYILSEFPDIKAGHASITVDIYAGRQNHVRVPVSVTDVFLAPGHRGEALRYWAPFYDQIYVNTWNDFEYENRRVEYQWYQNDKNDTVGGMELDQWGESFLPYIDPQTVTNPIYYYCKMTYTYDFDERFPEKSSVYITYSTPAGIYPFNTTGLQSWIDDAGPKEPVIFPAGKEFYITGPVTFSKNTVFWVEWDTSADAVIKRGFDYEGDLFVIGAGKSLTLIGNYYNSLVLDGWLDDMMTGSLIKVENGGTLITEYGAVLCKNKAEKGGAVYVDAGGTFIMNAGSIERNYAEGTLVEIDSEMIHEGGGGGVYLAGKGASFVMNDGIIGGNGIEYGNSAVNGGAVYVGDSATFTMKEGVINCNYAFSDGSNGSGGGVYVTGGALFEMSGGIIGIDFPEDMMNPPLCNISDWEGGGVYITGGGKFTMDGSAKIKGNTTGYAYGIRDTSGGGVSVCGVSSVFTMNGEASVEQNISYFGGGIAVIDGAGFIMNGGIVQKNMTLNDSGEAEGCGGGVYVSGSGMAFEGGIHETVSFVPSSFTMNNGAIITSNESDGGGGAAICNGAVFTMKGGDILMNTAVEGGGVWCSASAAFEMSGGNISGNRAGMYGGGVNANSTAKFTMKGGVIGDTDSEKDGNFAYDGGGVFIENYVTFDLLGGVIGWNRAASQGGGVSTEYYSTFTMDGGSIIHNVADNGGGGVKIGMTWDGEPFRMKNGSISWNTGYVIGGGVYIGTYGAFDMTGGEIKGNSALAGLNGGGNGGGVYYSGGTSQPFSKTGGVIYGDNENENSNICENKGIAAYSEFGGFFINSTVAANNEIYIHPGIEEGAIIGNWQQ